MFYNEDKQVSPKKSSPTKSSANKENSAKPGPTLKSYDDGKFDEELFADRLNYQLK